MTDFPIKLDFANIREERQKINNLLAFESLSEKNISKNINKEAFKKVLVDLDITKEELFNKLSRDILFAKLLASKISKLASRQGIKEELLQINTCNITSSKYGIFINNLTSVEYRPTKNGEIISDKVYKEQNYNKNDCLKSFDAKITGKINGWVSAKVVMTNGGHQDNVFEELYTFCEWIIKYSKNDDKYIILLDTNLIEKSNGLKKKYNEYKNIIIGNHFEIQQYFIDNYSESNK